MSREDIISFLEDEVEGKVDRLFNHGKDKYIAIIEKEDDIVESWMVRDDIIYRMSSWTKNKNVRPLVNKCSLPKSDLKSLLPVGCNK